MYETAFRFNTDWAVNEAKNGRLLPPGVIPSSEFARHQKMDALKESFRRTIKRIQGEAS